MRPYPCSLLMIRPIRFGYNAQTAVNNAFQNADENQNIVQTKALEEFDAFVELLRSNNIDVLVVEDTPEPHTPDSIFPNNWISTHEDGSIILYPMYAENRRLERKQDVIQAIKKTYHVLEKDDFSGYESDNMFLEGTGSMILDRKKRIAYACLSERTNAELFNKFCKLKGYQGVVFDAFDQNNQPIYHTNVMMCLGDNYAVVCLDSITDEDEKELVISTLKNTAKTIIPITFEQMNHFAGNMFQVKNREGMRFLIMSDQAYKSLTPEQIKIIEVFNPILHPSLYTIEKNGGGSARCMLAEIVLTKK